MDFFRSEIFSHFMLQTIAMALTALVLPRLRITSIFGAAGCVLALAVINSTIWDAALFFSVPNSLSSQTGLLFLANGLLFWVLVKLLPGIEVRGFFPAVLAPVVFTMISLVIYNYGRHIDWVDLGSKTVNAVVQARDSLRGAANEQRLEPDPEPSR